MTPLFPLLAFMLFGAINAVPAAGNGQAPGLGYRLAAVQAMRPRLALRPAAPVGIQGLPAIAGVQLLGPVELIRHYAQAVPPAGVMEILNALPIGPMFLTLCMMRSNLRNRERGGKTRPRFERSVVRFE